MRSFLILAAIGAVVGTLGDYAHFACGIDGYPPGGARLPWLGLPLWVPGLFAAAALALTAAHRLAGRFRAKEAAPARPALIAGALGFPALYLLSAFLPPSLGLLKDLALAFCAIATWWATDRSAVGAALALATAAAGVGTEAWLVSRGIFFYLPSSAAFLGVPSWLGWLYVAASVAVGCLLRLLCLGELPGNAV